MTDDYFSPENITRRLEGIPPRETAADSVLERCIEAIPALMARRPTPLFWPIKPRPKP